MAKAKKKPLKVTTHGDIACADLSGIAKLLVELSQKPKVSLVQDKQSSFLFEVIKR